jgi:Pyruvate/2-oxoacid:ferredoxin oxidoreductase delta subunit
MASGPRNLLETATGFWRLPEVTASRCVHSRLETASCRRCLDACPRDAWVLDDDRLGIDIAACDGCALCVPACPEGAVSTGHRLEIRSGADGREYGFAACEHGATGDAPGRMPCVHAIGLSELLRLYRRGGRCVFVARGACGACGRDAVETVDARLAALNGLLGGRGLPEMRMVLLGARRWGALREASSDATRAAIKRRDFLRELTGRAVERIASRALPAADPATAGNFTPPGRLLPRVRDGQRVFFSPDIDPLLCNGCDACLRLCPHQALGIAATGDAYTVDADACSGCRMCADACDRGAIRVTRWAEPRAARVALAKGRCRGCGVAFHRPAVQGKPGAWCRICGSTGNHRKLFQVLE